MKKGELLATNILFGMIFVILFIVFGNIASIIYSGWPMNPVMVALLPAILMTGAIISHVFNWPQKFYKWNQ